MRCVGTVVRGIRTPIIKENDDLITPDTTSPLIEEEIPNTPPKDDDFNPTQNDNTTTENNPDNSIKWLCYVNQIDGTASGAPLYLDPAKHYTQNLNNDEIATYFGKNLCSIGADYKYTGPDFHTVTYNNENVLVRDTASFSYAYANTSFTVMASKITTPYDCIYALEEQRITKVGTANGPVDVLFAATVGGNEKQPEIQKLMVADFQYNRVYYRVTAENISVTDFYNIVCSILK